MCTRYISPSSALKKYFHVLVDVYGDAVFAETVHGLADALHALGIANKIVTFVDRESENLYIVMFASSEVTLELPTIDHIWNLTSFFVCCRQLKQSILSSGA